MTGKKGLLRLLPTYLPRGTHPRIKAWLSKLGVGHEDDNLSVEMLRCPKKNVKIIIGKDLTRPCIQ
jgi:hypothetical protein